MGMIIITHDLAILAETCTHIAVMYAGKIVETGTADDIFGHARHPYTKRLIGCFPNVSGEKIIPESIAGYPPILIEPPTGCRFHPRCERATPRCATEEPETVSLGGRHTASCHLISSKEADDNG